MEISRIIWLEDIVEKLLWKHNVEEIEVIEVLENLYSSTRKQVINLESTYTRLLVTLTQNDC